jgi:hypothetical protein
MEIVIKGITFNIILIILLTIIIAMSLFYIYEIEGENKDAYINDAYMRPFRRGLHHLF